MANDWPKYPIFSWRPTITGTVDYDDGTTSGTIDLATDLGSTYWGHDGTTLDVANSTSVQGRFSDLLKTAVTASNVKASYVWPNGDHAPPLTRYSVTHTASIALTFSSAAVAAQFGFDGVSQTLSHLATTDTDFTDAGHWQPSQRGGSDERWKVNPNVGIAEAIDGSARKTRSWGSALTSRAFSFPAVYVANIRSDAAAESSQATAAGRDVADPNSLLETMIEAARTPESTDDARAFRVYSSAGVYRTCYFVDPDEIQRVESLCENQSARRIWRVSFAMRDDG